MLCQVCNKEEATQKFTIWDNEFNFCSLDATRVERYAHSLREHYVVNVFWGVGHIDWGSWYNIRDFIRSHGITEVLEIGCGLSSELFVNEGLKLIGFDTVDIHVKVLQDCQPMKDHAVFHYYGEKDYPNIQEIYPGRKWDFVFIDGPQVRDKSVKAAMEVASKYIILHDPNMGEESYFPGTEWKEIGFKTYERISQ